jgi:hypothetical protein
MLLDEHGEHGEHPAKWCMLLEHPALCRMLPLWSMHEHAEHGMLPQKFDRHAPHAPKEHPARRACPKWDAGCSPVEHGEHPASHLEHGEHGEHPE